jgi:gliding motility-associated-like protein
VQKEKNNESINARNGELIMYKRIQHIILLVLLISSMQQAVAQIAMPDSVCVGTTKTYSVNTPAKPSTYTWKLDGVTQSSTRNSITITWNNSGVFELTVQERDNNGCDGDIRSGFVYVKPLPIANAGPDVTVCFGNTIRLNGSGGTSYQWIPATGLSNSSIANPVATITAPGTNFYTLYVTLNGCRSLLPDTVAVKVLPPVKVFAGRDTAVAVNQPLQLNALDVNNSGFISYTWSPPIALSNPLSRSPVALFTSPGNTTYTVVARTVDGCTDRDDIKVSVFAKADVYVPTGFTPNGDGLNDFSVAIPVGIKEFRYFRIFNRWGEQVFSTNDASKGWDGMWKGQPQPPGAFAWETEAVDFTGKIIFKSGTVILIR